jgi:hypothetical protein
MRTMGNLVAVVAAGVILVLSSRPTQACYGLKNCSICAAKACCRGYGYPGYGYASQGYGYASQGYGYASQGYGYGYPGYGCGYGYGSMPNGAYRNPYSYGSGYYYCYGTTDRRKSESSSSTDTASSEAEKQRIKELEDKVARLEGQSTTRTPTGSAQSAPAGPPGAAPSGSAWYYDATTQRWFLGSAPSPSRSEDEPGKKAVTKDEMNEQVKTIRDEMKTADDKLKQDMKQDMTGMEERLRKDMKANKDELMSAISKIRAPGGGTAGQ